ncbi:MAG: cell filamentation protein Fic, partial [Marinirhabdus sp.]
MATLREKLAGSLQALRKTQEERDSAVIKTSEINRAHRERLTKNGFLKKVAKGWYTVANPNEGFGDSTSWYTSYWQFCSRYLENKYGGAYCISAEQSILMHSGNSTVPGQLIIRSPKAPNKKIPLLHNTSLFEMKSKLPNTAAVIEVNGIRTLSRTAALINCSPTMFEKNPTDMRVVLALIPDAAEILTQLLEGSHSVIAGRLAGAFRNIGQNRIADEIVLTMKMAGFDVRETNPFKNKLPIKLSFRERSPYANRIKIMWEEHRKTIIEHFPDSPGPAKNDEAYLNAVDQMYVTDAYHSLSIEKYNVSVELIEKVRRGGWQPEENKTDRDQKDAMAARGYWQATQAVKNSIKKILGGANPGTIADQDHTVWYRQLFASSVTVGILKPADLAGYRTTQVYI